MPNDDYEECPHCSVFTSRRTIRRHLKKQRDDAGRFAGRASANSTEATQSLADVAVEMAESAPQFVEGADEELAGSDDAGSGDSDVNQDDVDMAMGAIDPGANHPPPPEPERFVRRNPPVTIEDWSDLDSDGDESASEIGDENIDIEDQDPEFIEAAAPPGYNPLDEPEFTDKELRRLLEERLGFIDDQAWFDLHNNELSDQDRKILQFLAARLHAHFSRRTYDELRFGACEEMHLPSEFIAWRRLRILSGLEYRAYDCCIKSCCCFLGKYKDLNQCPYCREPRFNRHGKPRRVFRYSPLIPQLCALFRNRLIARRLYYRLLAEQAFEPGTTQDVFDSEDYRRLRRTQVSPDDPYCYFGNPQDLALGLSTDGFTLFKRRRRGHSTAWPIILINYNLHPKYRTRLENVICVGVIPGPQQCKDIHSFLVPLVDELLELERGVAAVGFSDDGEAIWFIFRAFIIIIFGDIPAISKLLFMKGHNAFSPCRACDIEGILSNLPGVSVYYVPHMRPNQEQEWDCSDLPMRTHESFRQRVDEMNAAPTQEIRNDIAKYYGINSLPILSYLSSINLASSFPYDAMHLFFENIVPNLVLFWTGEYRGLDEGSGNFQLSIDQWLHVGQETTQAARTIPAEFVGTLPDIAQDRKLYKAEAYSFWIQFIAPIVLKGRLPEKYFKHMLGLREIIMLCLQFAITDAEIDELQVMVADWVRRYEEYYYQYNPDRLPACNLTIHGLLHVPYYIRRTGPLWASWAFVMERFCGHLLPAVKNRIRPYEHLDYYIQRRAQMQIVSATHDLPSLVKSAIPKRVSENGLELSSRETVYPDFPNVILGAPVNKRVELSTQLRNQFTKYFGVVYPELSAQQLGARIVRDSIVRYGRCRLAGDGDRIRTADLITRDPLARDNSYVRYELLPDANAAFRNRIDVPYRETQYGQLLDIYYLEFIQSDNAHVPYLLAFIQPCDTSGLDATLRGNAVVQYNRMLTPHMAHIETITAVIGRVRRGNFWAIVDRSRHGARTQFVDDDGNDFD